MIETRYRICICANLQKNIAFYVKCVKICCKIFYLAKYFVSFAACNHVFAASFMGLGAVDFEVAIFSQHFFKYSNETCKVSVEQ